MLDPVCVADHVKTHRPGIDCHAFPGLLIEVDTVVLCPLSHMQACAVGQRAVVFLQTMRGGKYCVNGIWNCVQQGFEKRPSRLAVRFVHQPRHSEFASSVDHHKQI